MVDFECMDSYGMEDLERIVALLRAPGGCPWDREQTHESIRRNMLEEAYEAAEAIDEKNPEHLKEELGDVLLQVVFHAQMAKEEGLFTFQDVVDGVAKKMVFRHPHVFGSVQAEDSDQALETWDAQKRQAAQGDGDPQEELGDLLFAAVKAGRFLHVDSEQALTQACEKFIRRFRAVERLAQGESLDQMELSQLEELWAQAKQQEG